jgi:hypothetical protein
MASGYAKFRRGLVDHLKDGRISADEYCVFSLVVQLADFHSGTWHGSGVALSNYLKWCPRQCQLILRSLEHKGYVQLRTIQGRKGNYPVIIHNYHGKSANGDALKAGISESRCADKAGSANGDATLKEVIQEELQKKKAAQPRRVTLPLKSEQEQRRIVTERDRRLEKEQDARKEARVGTNWISERIAELARGKAV